MAPCDSVANWQCWACWLSTNLHGFTSHGPVILIINAVRTSNLTGNTLSIHVTLIDSQSYMGCKVGMWGSEWVCGWVSDWVSEWVRKQGSKHFHSYIIYSCLDIVTQIINMKFYVPCFWQVNPLLIRIETKAGHGGGKPTTKVVSMSLNVLFFSYLWHCLDLTWFNFCFPHRFKKKLTYSVS